jgi:hypothetical protein
VLILVELVYILFEHHASVQTGVQKDSHQTRRLPKPRFLLAFGPYVAAMLVSLKFPWWGFASICCILLYLRPRLLRTGGSGAGQLQKA